MVTFDWKKAEIQTECWEAVESVLTAAGKGYEQKKVLYLGSPRCPQFIGRFAGNPADPTRFAGRDCARTHQEPKRGTPSKFTLPVSRLLDELHHYSSGQTSWGADPEFFVIKEGKLLPAWEYLPAEKSGHSLYADGFAAEFTVTPSGCLSYVVDSIHQQLQALKHAIKHIEGAKIVGTNFVELDPAELAEYPSHFVQLGCQPSRNAYGLQPIRADGFKVPFRSTGGHLHFGVSSTYLKGRLDSGLGDSVVKFLDVMLGLPVMLMAQNIDNPMRRRLYGRAGEYRTPAHGLEYRVLSNVWLLHPTVTMMVYEWARLCFGVALWGLRDILPITDEEVQLALNTGKISLAQDLWERVKPFARALVPLMHNWSLFGKTAEELQPKYDRFLELLTTPLDKTCNHEAVADNWLLDNRWLLHAETKNVSIYKSEWFA